MKVVVVRNSSGGGGGGVLMVVVKVVVAEWEWRWGGSVDRGVMSVYVNTLHEYLQI